jgi:uncharacterized protein YegP (UPF0339 family)
MADGKYARLWRSPNDGQWYWTIRGGNHEPMTHSEGYTTRASALAALRKIFGGPIKED